MWLRPKGTYVTGISINIFMIFSNGGYFIQAPSYPSVNTLRLRQNGRHFPDNIFKCIFMNENVWISMKISLKFVPKSPINNIPALVQIMAWRRSGIKPLSEPMMVSLLTHICVTQPQWVNWSDFIVIFIFRMNKCKCSKYLLPWEERVRYFNSPKIQWNK